MKSSQICVLFIVSSFRVFLKLGMVGSRNCICSSSIQNSSLHRVYTKCDVVYLNTQVFRYVDWLFLIFDSCSFVKWGHIFSILYIATGEVLMWINLIAVSTDNFLRCLMLFMLLVVVFILSLICITKLLPLVWLFQGILYVSQLLGVLTYAERLWISLLSWKIRTLPFLH